MHQVVSGPSSLGSMAESWVVQVDAAGSPHVPMGDSARARGYERGLETQTVNCVLKVNSRRR